MLLILSIKKVLEVAFKKAGTLNAKQAPIEIIITIFSLNALTHFTIAAG